MTWPDPAYQARFWRDILAGRTKFTSIQVIGLAIVGLVVLSLAWEILRSLASSWFYWCVLAFFALIFLLLRWRVRKALGEIERQQQAK